MELDRMDLIPKNEVFQNDKRNTRKMFLATDAICTQCGIIFNSAYEDDCVICDPEINNIEDIEYENKSENKSIRDHVEKARQYVKEIDKIDNEKRDDNKEVKCEHKDFIIGRQGVDLRILLDFHVEDLRALCEIHGCTEGGSRGKMVINIMKQLYPYLDKRINENLVRKMIVRNRKKFRFWKDIEDAITRAKKPGKIKIVDAEECIEITEIIKDKKM
jgi:soluble cytochrome b562